MKTVDNLVTILGMDTELLSFDYLGRRISRYELHLGTRIDPWLSVIMERANAGEWNGSVRLLGHVVATRFCKNPQTLADDLSADTRKTWATMKKVLD